MNKCKAVRCVGHTARARKKRNAITAFVGKPPLKTSLRSPRHRWENGIKISFKETV
jgi:hypothetical protein